MYQLKNSIKQLETYKSVMIINFLILQQRPTSFLNNLLFGLFSITAYGMHELLPFPV